jgi:hypothetical protein
MTSLMPHGPHRPRLPRPIECGVCAAGGTSTSPPRTVSQESPIFVPFIPPSFQGKMGVSPDMLAPCEFRPIWDDGSCRVLITLATSQAVGHTWISWALCVGWGSVVSSTRPRLTSNESFKEGFTTRKGSSGMAFD